MPVIHCTGSSSRTSGSTRIQPRVNRNKKTFQASGVQWIRSRIHQNPPCIQRGVRGSTRILLAYTLHTAWRTGIHENPPRVKYLIVLIWIPVRHALCGSGPQQDPQRVITPLHLMDPGVRLTPGGSPCTLRSGSRALADLYTLVQTNHQQLFIQYIYIVT